MAAENTRMYARRPARAGEVRILIKPPVEERAQPLWGVEEVQAERLGGCRRRSGPRRPPGLRLGVRPRRSCPSFSIAMYSCVPAKELDIAW
jgi:hypothetical protein